MCTKPANNGRNAEIDGHRSRRIQVQLSATAYRYRDALRFKNGREILLQKLQCGQQVDVQYLSSGDFQEAEHQKLEEEYGRVFYTLRRRAHKEPASATRASA